MNTIRTKYIDKLYKALLEILRNPKYQHLLSPDVLEKMSKEQRNVPKIKAIRKYWDLFNAPSNNPNVSFALERDYLWDKFVNTPNDEEYLESLDTDNDGDVDKTDVSNIASAIVANDLGREFDTDNRVDTEED